jgi:hypothetical protein
MATKEKPRMVTAVFRDRLNAQSAYDMLRNRGYLDSEINVLMSDKTRSAYLTGDEAKQKLHAGTMAAEGAGIGGAVGTAAGATAAAIAAAVAAVGSVVVPGLGLVVAGPLVAAFAGGGAGAVAGGVIGILVGAGIPEDNAKAYHEALRVGGVVLGVVPHSGDDAGKLKEQFKNLQGEDICYC